MTDHAERDAREPREPETRDEQSAAPAGDPVNELGDAGAENVDEDLAVVADDVFQMRRQVEEQRDKYLRLAAEYDNFRKRAIRERNEASSRGQAELARHVLEPLDDLARFAHLDPATTDAKTIVEGAAMVERKLLKVLGAAGLEVVDPLDQIFDPNVHEAVATEPAASSEDDHVVSRVYQVGYRFNGLLLRPARVVVKQWNG